MSKKEWLDDYFARYQKDLFNKEIYDKLIELESLCRSAHEAGKKVIFMGNGGSAAIASHAAIDMSKNGHVRAMAYNDPAVITCLANDYGHENWMASALDMYADPGDVLVLISSSGRSQNVVNAAEKGAEKDLKVVTFTGFAKDNPLKSKGSLNFWLDSKAYNVVENIHQVWILTVVDMLIGNAEYSAN